MEKRMGMLRLKLLGLESNGMVDYKTKERFLEKRFCLLSAHQELTEMLGGTCNFDEYYVKGITAGLVFYGKDK